MNYIRIYEQLIKRAQERQITNKLTCYFEIHHIIPKCLGGEDIIENLVDLTAKEHFIAHALLCKIFPKNHSLLSAFHMMSHCSDGTQERYIPSCKYSKIKDQYSQSVSDFFVEFHKNNPEHRYKNLARHNQNSDIQRERAEKNWYNEDGSIRLKALQAVQKTLRELNTSEFMRRKSIIKAAYMRYVNEWCGDNIPNDKLNTDLKRSIGGLNKSYNNALNWHGPEHELTQQRKLAIEKRKQEIIDTDPDWKTYSPDWQYANGLMYFDQFKPVFLSYFNVSSEDELRFSHERRHN